MKTIFPNRTNMIAPTRNKTLFYKNQIFNLKPNRSNTTGSSMIELLIAAVVALFAASAAAQIITNLNSSGLSRRAVAGTTIDVAISNDLAWFQQYAMLWRMIKGPYTDLPIQLTRADKIYTPIQDSSKESNQYEPKPNNECPPFNPNSTNTTMATNFQQDAADTLTYVAPINNPPNPIPSPSSPPSEQSIALPKAASDYTLSRKIMPGSVLGSLKIIYTLKKSGVTQFIKTSAVYLPASGWCP